jgi:hypothetical protein
MLAPVSIEKTFEENVAVWSTPHRGFDYAPLRRYAANGFLSDRRKDASGELLAQPQAVASADFYTATDTNLDARTTFDIEKEGICHGLHSWIRIHLGDEWVATGPIKAPMHWTAQSLPLDPPLQVSAGQTLEARLRRPAYGEWTWNASAPSGKRQHSTFLSMPLDAKSLSKISPNAKVRVSERGRAALRAMTLMDGKLANSEIALSLLVDFPRQFVDSDDALRFVTSLAGRFG